MLAACGGGGVASLTAGGAVAQSCRCGPTDNLATDYSTVWVSIEKITAIDSNGTEVTLLDASTSPAGVNLSSLASVGQLMATANVAPGLYTEVRVTLLNSVQLVSPGGTTITAKFSPIGSEVVVHVRNLALDPGASGQLVLDFNLAKFTYDANTGLVAPTVEAPKASDAFAKFVHQQAAVNGLVQSIDRAGQSLTVDDPHLGRSIVVTLGADAVIVDETSGATIPFGSVAPGAHVEIRGAVKPGPTTADPVTVVASVVHVERALPPAALETFAGAGKVSSVNGQLVTVALREASLPPGADSVVVGIGSAHFTHGQPSDLAPGVAVAFRGSASGAGGSTVVLASDIDVQGAPSQSDLQQHPQQTFTAVNGTIATLNADGTFTVAVPKADGPVVVPGTYTVDPLHAIFMEGNASCLAVGAIVQAVGSLVDTTLSAKFMNVENCTGEVRSEPPPPAPAPTGDSAPK